MEEVAGKPEDCVVEGKVTRGPGVNCAKRRITVILLETIM